MNGVEPGEDEVISKTRRKRQMHALQCLGERLVELSVERLAKIDMPGGLRDAVMFARHVTRFEARRRQMQYIGRLMREADPAPIQAALEALDGQSAAETARVHRIERLRERLLQDEQVLGEIAASFAGADLQQLRSLRRSALNEREAGKPPRSFRELFRVLRGLEADKDQSAAEAHTGGARD